MTIDDMLRGMQKIDHIQSLVLVMSKVACIGGENPKLSLRFELTSSPPKIYRSF